MFFLVFSSKVEDYDSVQSIVLAYAARCSKSIVVKEFGKKGNHPHLNVVCTETVKAEKNLYRKIYKILGDDLVLRNPRLLKITCVVDFKRLVQGYLSKESNAEVLYKKGFNYRSPQVKIDIKKHLYECRQLAKELWELGVGTRTPDSIKYTLSAKTCMEGASVAPDPV